LAELVHARKSGFATQIFCNTASQRALSCFNWGAPHLSDIVLRDVLNRHKILNHLALNQIVSWYLANIACLHSYTAIKNAFGISTDLAATLSSYLAEAYLAFELSRYHLNMKVQTRDPKKVYLIDNGLRTVSLLSEREDWGRLAENIVYIELRRRNKQVSYCDCSLA
jgi:predicted AAA+ superfamily ATPase